MTEIVQQEHPVLRKHAETVKKDEIGTEKIRVIIKNMKEALSSQDDGVAIAAPQINEQLRIFVVSKKVFGGDEDPNVPDRVFINPVITNLSRKKEDMDEGCLSVRWKYGTVKRSSKATVEALDEQGNSFSYNGSDLLAQIFQHEVDHLDGVLFTDKATNLQDIDPKDIKNNSDK